MMPSSDANVDAMSFLMGTLQQLRGEDWSCALTIFRRPDWGDETPHNCRIRRSTSRRHADSIPPKDGGVAYYVLPRDRRTGKLKLAFLRADGRDLRLRAPLGRAFGAGQSNDCLVAARTRLPTAKHCPILSGAISGNQGLKCPYLAEILDSELVFLAANTAT